MSKTGLNASNSNNPNFLMQGIQTIRSLPVEFIFLTLPYRDIKGTVYQRESDTTILTITSGYNADSKEYYGIPYGIYPRLILYFICSEVRRTGSKEIYLGKNVQDILERLAITNKGVRNTGKVLQSFKEQLLRLTSAVITVTSKKYELQKKDTKLKVDSVKIVKKIEFWKKSTHVDYNLTLTEDFYNYLLDSSVTVFDAKILQAIKSSPVTLDLYVLLNYKAFIANKFDKDVYVSFEELYNYFGTKNSFRSFKQNIKKSLLNIIAVYPQINITFNETTDKNVIVVKKDSMSTIQPDLFAVNEETKLSE